jgi:hypothetical protein
MAGRKLNLFALLTDFHLKENSTEAESCLQDTFGRFETRPLLGRLYQADQVRLIFFGFPAFLAL